MTTPCPSGDTDCTADCGRCKGTGTSPPTWPGRETTPCMSRHFDNVGKPRPPVEWSIAYGCTNGHAITTEVCDGCATALTDGRQRCGRCFRPMVVTVLDPIANGDGQAS